MLISLFLIFSNKKFKYWYVSKLLALAVWMILNSFDVYLAPPYETDIWKPFVDSKRFNISFRDIKKPKFVGSIPATPTKNLCKKKRPTSACYLKCIFSLYQPLFQFASQELNNAIVIVFGAGDGNRTRVISLEGWCSTIKLHLRAWLLYYTRY